MSKLLCILDLLSLENNHAGNQMHSRPALPCKTKALIIRFPSRAVNQVAAKQQRTRCDPVPAHQARRLSQGRGNSDVPRASELLPGESWRGGLIHFKMPLGAPSHEDGLLGAELVRIALCHGKLTTPGHLLIRSLGWGVPSLRSQAAPL